MEQEALFAVMLVCLAALMYNIFRDHHTKAYQELKSAGRDLRDIQRAIRPLEEEQIKPFEPYIDHFKTALNKLKTKLTKLEQDKFKIQQASKKFIAKVNQGHITPETFTKEALKLNEEYKEILKKDFQEVEAVVQTVRSEIITLQRQLAPYLPGRQEMRTVLLDLQDMLERFKKIEEFFAPSLVTDPVPKVNFG